MQSREENCEISGPDSEVGVDKETEPITKAQNQRSKFQVAVDDKNGKNLGLHARAMLITRPVKSSTGDFIEVPVHEGFSGG